MSTANMSAHHSKQHHKSKSNYNQRIPKLELQHLSNSNVSNGTKTKAKATSTRTRSKSTKRGAKKSKKPAPITLNRNNSNTIIKTKSYRKYSQYKHKSLKSVQNTSKKTKKKAKKHKRYNTATKIKNPLSLSRTAPHAKSLKIPKTKKKRNVKKGSIYSRFNGKKHLKLQTKSYSERSRTTRTNRRNYYYYNYNKPDDIFAEKPMSRRRPSSQTQTVHKSINKKSKKSKKSKKQNSKKSTTKTSKRRPLSSRLSDNTSGHDEFETKMDLFDGDDGMQYLNYDFDEETETETMQCSPIDDIDHDLDEMLTALKQDIEEDTVHRLPFLSLTHSLSERRGHKSSKPFQKRSKIRSKTPLHKTKLTLSRKTQSLHKTKPTLSNKTQSLHKTKPTLSNKTQSLQKKPKKKKKRRDSALKTKDKKKKTSLKPTKAKSSRKIKSERLHINLTHSVSNISTVEHIDSNHSKNAKSIEIALCNGLRNDNGAQRPASSDSLKHLPTTPVFFTRMSDKYGNKTRKRLSKSQHATPTSPLWANNAKIDIDQAYALRGKRNTIVLGKDNRRIIPTPTYSDTECLNLLPNDSTNSLSSSSISLGALSHYFQYHANHETKSILAQLAGIIMELVGEPNIFYLNFKVEPHVGMAIRRNKLRISPILHHGLVLSFAMNRIPPQLQQNEEEEEEEMKYMDDLDYISPLEDVSNNTTASADISMEPSPCPGALPESDLGFTSTSEEDNDNGNDDDDTKDGYDTSHYNDFNSSMSISPSPPMGVKSKFKSDEDLMDTSCTSLRTLSQSQTETTNTPTLSPHDPHLMGKSNSDIFKFMNANGSTNNFDNVELFRRDKHLYTESNGSFSSFSIGSPRFNTEIRSNTYSEASYNHQNGKSFGSDMTMISVSNTTVLSHHKLLTEQRIAEHRESDLSDDDDDDGMIYFDDSYGDIDSTTNKGDDLLKLKQEIRTPFSDASAVRTPMFDIDVDMTEDAYVTGLPSFGYGSSTNISSFNTNSGSIANSGKSGINYNNAYEFDDLSIFAKNVKVPSPAEYVQKMGIKARLSTKFEDYRVIQSETSNTPDLVTKLTTKSDDHESIPYDTYDEFESIDCDSKLQLSVRESSTYSIPGIGTIQVTTPGTKHKIMIFQKEHIDTIKDEKVEEDDIEEIKFPYYRSETDGITENDENDDNDEEKEEEKSSKSKSKSKSNSRRRRIPKLTRQHSNKSNGSGKGQLNTRSRSNTNRIISTTPKFTTHQSNKPVLQLSKRSRMRSQTCTKFDDSFFSDVFGSNDADLYQSIVFSNGSFLSPNISMISPFESSNVDGDESVVKFSRAFNKMVADENGNIFIGTDKYIRYITYNKNSNSNYGKFRKQEKLLYELSSDEHLVSLWNQDGKIYFVTMPYALQDNHYRESQFNSLNNGRNVLSQWSLNLFVVENKNNLRQSVTTKYEWIPPSVRDKLPYRKVRTFRWRVRGACIENFLSIWYDEKYETLITLAECDRLNCPQIIFLNKKNDRGLQKLNIRNNTLSIYGSDDSHDDGVDNHLLIRHKPTKSWLCCIPCVDRCDGNDDENNENNECWIQFKLSRENMRIIWSKCIVVPLRARKKKWLGFDEKRDCIIGINRLNIEQLLGLHSLQKKKEIELIVVPRLTKLLQENGTNIVYNNKNNENTQNNQYKRRRTRQTQRKRSQSQKRLK